MAYDVKYVGSLPEYHGRIACAEDDPENPGRLVLRLWTDPLGFNQPATLRRVRPASAEQAFLCRGPGLTCACGLEHDRS